MAETYFSLHLWLISFILFVHSGLIHQTQSQVISPTISTVKVFKHTQNGNKVESSPEYWNGTTTTIITSTGWELELTCNASYPVEWVTNGHIGEEKLIQVQEVKRCTIGIQQCKTNDFYSRLIFPLESFHTGPVACRSINNISAVTALFVFVKDPQRAPFIDSRKNFDYVDPKIVPCAITDPELDVKLWTNGREVSDVTYSPKMGFSLHGSSENLSSHKVECRVGDDLKYDYRITSSILNVDPDTKNVAAFENSLIKLSCKSNKKITTRFPQNTTPELSISVTKINDYYSIITVQGKSGQNGTVTCDNGDQWQQWHFKFYDSPKIYTEPFMNYEQCATSDNDNGQFTSLSCRNQNTCNINRQCLQTGKCPQIFQKGLSRHGIDLVIKEAPLSGLLQCSLDGAQYTTEIFHGLNDKIYYDANTAAISNTLVQLVELPPILFNDEETLIVCNSVGYLFQRHSKFVVVYNNGTNKTLQDDDVRDVEDEEFFKKREKPGVILYAGYVNLTKEMKQIHCLAPWANSSDWYDVYKNVTVIDAKKPTVKLSTKKAVLMLGSSKRFTCEVEGLPEPTVVWKTNATDVNTTKEVKNGIVYFNIVFLNVNPSHTGQYICHASNRIGSSEEYLNVTTDTPEGVIAKKSQSLFTLLELNGRNGIIAGSLVAFLIVVVLLVMIFLWVQCSRTKKMTRNLTDDEVRQFLEGSPAFIKSVVHEYENVPYLPYDKKFEIPMKQLELGNNTVLGSGTFGMVVQGKHKGMPVAVRLARPNADINYLKALMAELKIMMYIDKHENVVSFIGAFTDHIKNRILYITLELCPGGDLQSRLKKYKHQLQSSKNEIQSPEIYASASEKMAKKEQKINLKNIDWSRQIADGMEYLASKMVIHGDLSARNVLLSAEDVAKVTDFGLRLQLYNSSFYSKKTQPPLPYWQWMAVESLSELEFSTKSDIWSYGVTLWEMYSLGDFPFPGQAWTSDFVEIIHKGTRMKKPKYASNEIYELMCQCWSISPDRRPTFHQISEFFQQLSEELQEHIGSNTNTC